MNKNTYNKLRIFFGYSVESISEEIIPYLNEVLIVLLHSYHDIVWCREIVDSFDCIEDVVDFLQDFQDVPSELSFIEINFTNYSEIEKQKAEERYDRIVDWVKHFGALSENEIKDYCKEFNLELNEALKRNIVRDISISNSPELIFNLLSKDVIGQDQAKKTLAVELFNHSIRKEASLSFSNEELVFPKSNVLMVGPSGSGKTFLAKKCAELIDVPFIKIDAASTVKSGIVGNSIMDHFQSYYCATEDKRKLEYSIVLIDEFDKLATHYAYDRSAIQNELLTLIGENGEASFEPARNQPKVKLNCSNMLFILCGAFQDLTSNKSQATKIGYQYDSLESLPESINRTTIQRFGFSAEIMNRINKIVHLEQLTEREVFELIKSSNSSPIIPYINIFAKLGKQIHFTDCFFGALAQQVSSSALNGRGPAVILSQVMEDFLYKICNQQQKIIIDKTYLN